MFKTKTRTLQAAAVVAAACASFGSIAADTFMNGQSIYGQPAASATADRQVDLAAATGINVAYGETVSFRNEGGQQFAWTFDGLDQRAVVVAKIAPAGFTAKAVTVYVGKNPLSRS
ncbi:MAG: CzcE family metal-binding protein [Rubrivivax sp.]